MRTVISPLARTARQTTVVARASSSQAGSSKPAPKQAKRLPKPVLRDLVKLHHTASTFMHDPSQLPSAFKAAFNTAQPDQISYADYQQAAEAARGQSRDTGSGSVYAYDKLSNRADEPCPTFGKSESQWSDAGAAGSALTFMTERQKQVREALFGTYERGPGESIRPGLDGIEEWLRTSGTSVQQVARDWEGRHDDVVVGSPRETEDGR